MQWIASQTIRKSFSATISGRWRCESVFPGLARRQNMWPFYDDLLVLSKVLVFPERLGGEEYRGSDPLGRGAQLPGLRSGRWQHVFPAVSYLQYSFPTAAPYCGCAANALSHQAVDWRSSAYIH